MPDPHMPLTPDDEQPAPLQLDDDTTVAPWRPDAYVGILVALIALLALGAVMDTQKLLRIDLAIILGLGAYLGLAALRPRINLLGVCIAAAVTGMLYGMPVQMLYALPSLNTNDIVSLAGHLMFAMVGGLLVGRGLFVERMPRLIIPISFFLMFVIANVSTLMRR